MLPLLELGIHKSSNLELWCNFLKYMIRMEIHKFVRCVLSDVLHHVREQNLLLDEVCRLLKPGGRFLVNEVDLERALGRGVASLETLFFVRVFPTSFRELGEKLGSIGFRLMEEKRDAWSFIGLWRFAPQSP